jgi:tetratricopeptide (TPR) repeat protein
MVELNEQQRRAEVEHVADLGARSHRKRDVADIGKHRATAAFGAVADNLESQIEDASEAIRLSPAYAEAHLFLTRVLLRRNEVDKAVNHLELALRKLPQQRELTPMFVDAAMAVAAAGHGDRVSSLLMRDEFGSTMEPLVVALRIKRGDTPIVAKEVMEVALDIANNAPE